jgi:phosphopantothenoylcysteine decarboxylase/phosphopantothenate--cysteine ligase
MKILLGVGGGIAAYKAAEVARLLMQREHEVQAILTRSAEQFIRPLTFAALTGRKALTDLFEVEDAIEHIAVAQAHEMLVVAPATADLMAKLAHGLADDFLSTLYLAFTGPVLIAPTMNVNMWEHAATQETLATLRARGVHVVDPDEGYLACGMTGAGRLAATETIACKVCEVLGLRKDLAGETILITAGPTREDLDPVRFLTNRSSGKMGYALAEAAVRRGARTILVSGPVSLDVPGGVDWVPVRSTEEMRAAVMARAPEATILIMAAAVADYRPAAVHANKIKRSEGRITLDLEPTADILAEVGRAKGQAVLIGFAAETRQLVENAREKLQRKGADMIVANDVTQEGAGFDTDTNIVTLVLRDGRALPLPKMTKREAADKILDQAIALRPSK